MTPAATTAAPPRVEKLRAVMARTSLSRSSIYRLARVGKFPAPIRLSELASGWLSDEVDAWLSERIAERDGR